MHLERLLSSARPRLAHLRHAAALAWFTALSTCASLDNIDVSSGGKASIPQATLVDKLLGQLTFAGFDKVDFTEEFKNQGVSKGDVDAVHLTSFTLTIDSPANGSFDFLKSVSFFAETDGQPRVKIASLAAVPKGSRTLDLVADASVDLAPYVVAPSMKISSEVEGGKPDQDTEVTATVVLDVDVHVPGCD